MIDLDYKIKRLLIKNFEIKLEKNEAAKSQQYEKAASLRDVERNLERTVYCLLYGIDDLYDWVKYENSLIIYFKDNFNVEYKSIDSYRQVIRIIKLNELGI